MSEQGSSELEQLMNAWESLIISEKDVVETSEYLGQGAYGTVYAATYHGYPCAIKKTHPILLKKSCKQFYKEAKAMQSLRHPSILPLYGIILNKDSSGICSVALVMERQWKSLSELIEKYQSLKVIVRLSLLHDVAGALSYLHGKDIMHCDLTPNNVLITEACRAKLSDFGQAINYKSCEHEKLSPCPGNSLYMPPEALKSQRTSYTYKLDVFSFGCLFIFTVIGLDPVPECEKFIPIPHNSQYEKVSEAKRRKDLISKLKSLTQKNVVYACLQDDPADRPDSADLCHKVEKCMKETDDSLLTAQVFEKSKLDLLQANLKLAITVSDLKKEKKRSNQENCNSDLQTELENARNQSAEKDIKIAEKDIKIAELKHEINVLTKVYAKALNEAEKSPVMSEQNSGSQLGKPFCTSVA